MTARAPTLDRDEDVQAAYTAHGGELYRFALRSLGDPGAAQDVVQETFLRAWRASRRFDPELASLRVWLFASARNVVVDHARRDGARPWLKDLVADPALDVVDSAAVTPKPQRPAAARLDRGGGVAAHR